MRSQGTLTSWNDEKGFGFITPDDASRQVFVHINSFSNRGRRPELNQAVSYALSSDSKGRPCATNVLFVGERRGIGFGSILIAVLFLAAIAIAAFHLNKIPRLIFGVYVIASLLAFFMYAKDKSAAKSGGWRTSESTLHLISLFCGWPGALIAQQTLRHKSKKQSFRFVFWVTVVLNCGAVAFLFIPEVAIEV
jgi:uncharacterized membrane protein YsdA (DUF1294 family)/cold shock CspA family protein